CVGEHREDLGLGMELRCVLVPPLLDRVGCGHLAVLLHVALLTFEVGLDLCPGVSIAGDILDRVGQLLELGVGDFGPVVFRHIGLTSAIPSWPFFSEYPSVSI